jgi:hypothetical protein
MTAVTVVDLTRPTVPEPANIVILADEECQAVIPDLTRQAVTDNCTPADRLVITQDPPAGTVVSLGTTIVAVRVTVRDESGNVAMVRTTNFRIMVEEGAACRDELLLAAGMVIGPRLVTPAGSAVDSRVEEDVVFVVDTGNGRVVQVEQDGSNPITVAGDCESDFCFLGCAQDQSPSRESPLTEPFDGAVPVDVAAREPILFIADKGCHRIYKVSRRVDGELVITVVAGTGVAGFSGDGRPATRAQLNSPRGIAFDSQGNLYIADSGNHVIRKVTNPGKDNSLIVTVAGNGLPGFLGDSEPANRARLTSPEGVAVDLRSGKLFIADTLNHRIRMVAAGEDHQITGDDIITIVAGSEPGFNGDGQQPLSNARFTQPSGIAIDQEGNLYIADRLNHRVRFINLRAGLIHTVTGSGLHGPDGGGCAGDGGLPNMGVLLDMPSKVVFDSMSDTLFIADTNNNRIRKVTGLKNGSPGTGARITTVTTGVTGQCP